MALSGTITKSITGRSYIIEWSAKQSTVDNTSIITCVHKLKNNTSYSLYIDPRSDNFCTVDGDKKQYKSPSISTYGGSTITLGTTTHTVSHDSNGEKTIKISGTFYIRATLSGTYVDSLTASADGIVLDTIPRASVINSFSGNDLTGNFSVSYTAYYSGFTNKLRLSIPSVKVLETFTYTSGTTFKLSQGSLNTLYSYTSNATKVQLEAVIETWNGSTKVGESKPLINECSIPNTAAFQPKVGTISLDPVNITTKDGVSRNILVKGKNTITVGVSGCQAGTGSSIKSYTYNVLSGSTIISTIGPTTSTSVSLGPFQYTGNLKFRVTVTDYRNRSTSNESSFYCNDYIVPYFKQFNIYRANSDGSANINGTYIQCEYTPEYSSVDSTNNVTVTAYYNNASKIGNNNSVRINLNGDVTTTYKVYLQIVDNYNGSNKTSTATIFGQSRAFNITPDGTGIALGKMAEKNNLFECRWPAKFNDTVTVPDSGGPVLNGDAVETLGYGTKIQSGDDLNDYTTPGVFASLEASVSETLSNTPITESGFRLVVEQVGSRIHIKQTVTSRAYACYTFQRYKHGDENPWGDWAVSITDKNINSYVNMSGYLPKSGGALTGTLTLPANKYYTSSGQSGINCNNSDLININGLYFGDSADSAGEGINFYRNETSLDTLYASNGSLKFHPGRSTDTGLSGYTIYNSSNFRRGTCTLNCTSDVSVSFTSALGGTPTVMLTPLTDVGGVIAGKIRSVSSSGFVATIGGSNISGDVKFAYLAVYG